MMLPQLACDNYCLTVLPSRALNNPYRLKRNYPRRKDAVMPIKRRL